jgi:membrane fusion protein (multidrug efflux system)
MFYGHSDKSHINSEIADMTPKSLFSLIFLGVLGACGKGGPGGPQGSLAIPVVVEKVGYATATYYDEYPAIVRALNEVELRPQVNGYVTGIHFKEGDQVRKGQRLYSIDQQQSEAAYQQALASLQVQETNLVKAKQDVERYRELGKSDAIAKQQVDYAEAAYLAAQKQVEAAKATVRSVQTNVRYSTIVAPFNGTIGISQVRLGTSVSTGQTLLNTISSDDPIAADIAVDQAEIYRFTQLMKSGSANQDSTFRLAIGSDVYPYPGKIAIIDRAVDAQTGTIKMRINFPNPDHTLRAGMSGTLQIRSSKEKSILIPYKSITEQLGEFFVYVADSSKVSQRRVAVGKQINKSVIILSGLEAGETVVTEGVQNLREGAAIEIAASPGTSK